MNETRSTQTLLELASDLEGQLQRAVLSRKESKDHEEFTRLASEANSWNERLVRIDELRRSSQLSISAEQWHDVTERLAAAARLIADQHTRLREDPSRVREGSQWRKTKAQVQEAATSAESVIAVAIEDLRATSERPSPGLLQMLPPNDPDGSSYQQLASTYDEADESLKSHQVEASDVQRFAHVSRRLSELRAQLEPRLVPEEHRPAWRALLDGRLRLSQLDDDFASWLKSAGHFDRLVVGFER